MGYNKRPLVLGFNDNTLIPSGLVEVILNLSDNGDVCDTKASDHQVLVWTGSEWCGSSIQFPAGGGGFSCGDLNSCDLDALANVCSDSPAANAVLAWNGSNWCPSSLPNTVPPPLPTGSPGDILVVKEGATSFATSLASGTLITNAIADQNIVVDGDLTAYVAKSQSSSDGEVLVSRGSGGFTGKIASGTLFDEGIADKNIVVDGDLAAYAAKGSGNTFTQTNVFQGETQLGTTTTKVDTDGNLTVDGNIDLIGTGHKLTIDDTIIDQDKAVLANVSANSVMISNDVSAASSVSGASGTVLYFEGDPARPGVQTINTILDNANYNISPNDSYLTTTNVKPPDVGMSSDGHMTFRTNATTFGTIASNANARTFITTDANFENLTNVTGISDTDDIADGSPLFWSKTHGTFSAIMANESDTPGTTQTNFLNLTASGGLTVEGDSVQKSVSSTSVTGIDIRAPGSVSSASVTGVDVTVGNNLNLSGALRVPDYTSLTGAGVPMVLHREVGAPVASSNSTSLAEVASYTLPANVLTLGDIDIMIRGRQLAQGSNLRWNFKIAGTNILNSSMSQGTFSDFTRYTMHIQISKMETDRQMVTARFVQGTGTGSAAGFSGWSSTHRDGMIHNEATGDESGTLALVLQAQQSDAAQIAAVDHFTVKLIPNPA